MNIKSVVFVHMQGLYSPSHNVQTF